MTGLGRISKNVLVPSTALACLAAAAIGPATSAAAAPPEAPETTASAAPAAGQEPARQPEKPAKQSDEAVSTRGDVRAGRVIVDTATPARGSTTILRLTVQAKRKPQLKVKSIGPAKAFRKVFAAGGAKKLGGKKGVKTFGVTVAVVNPKKSGKAAGKLRVSVTGAGVKLVKQETFTNSFSKPVPRAEMCKKIETADVSLTERGVRVAFDQKPVFGKVPDGYVNAQEVGAMTLLESCGAPVSNSFYQLVTGIHPDKKRAAADVKAFADAPRISVGPQSTDAVVLVSGWTSTTPFTAPNKRCAKTGYGPTWNTLATNMVSSGYPVYTAPVMADGGFVGGKIESDCPKQPDSSMTINSLGDIDDNSAALAKFLQSLNRDYGVKRVWLVGHSAGGMWSRGAMDNTRLMPNVTVQSITTLNTPHTGAVGAEIGEDNCEWWNWLCMVHVLEIRTLFAILAPGKAMVQLTGLFTAMWNTRMKGVVQVPVYAFSGNAADSFIFEYFSTAKNNGRFVRSNDLVVGIGSQQGDRLVSSGIVPNFTCFDTQNVLHIPLDGAAAWTLENLGIASSREGITSTVKTQADIQRMLNGSVGTKKCPVP